jgi:hypothetical protein
LASASPAQTRLNRSLLFWIRLSGGLFGWVLVEGHNTKKRRLLIVASVVLALMALLLLTGCGGGSSGLLSKISTQTVKVMATANAGNNSQHQINITVTVRR